jgi:hypothetical protein
LQAYGITSSWIDSVNATQIKMRETDDSQLGLNSKLKLLYSKRILTSSILW